MTYRDDVIWLGKNMRTIKRNIEALSFASKNFGLEQGSPTRILPNCVTQPTTTIVN